MERKRKIKKWVIFLFLSILFVQFLIYQFLKEEEVAVLDSSKVDDEIVIDNSIEKDENLKDEVSTIWIDIKGEVVKPGAYEMNSGLRVIDAIKKAGGLTKKADTRANNLSKRLSDEMLIIIYSKDEISNFVKTKEEEKLIEDSCISDKNNSCISSNDNVGDKETIKKVSINTGTLEELMSLPGIKEAKAKSIIEYRAKHLFTSIEEIMQVDGIKQALYDQIKNYITL